MPRISPATLRQAASRSSLLATLLPVCRDLRTAIAELRWIRQHVVEAGNGSQRKVKESVRELCRERGRGVPLQYVLGTQPFGPLEIICRPGVLIPRPEPEAYTEHLAELITAGPLQSIFPKSSSSNGLSVLDLCTGTGCIALLLAALLQSHHSHSQFHGVDISSAAIQLSQKNLRHNRASGHISQPPAVPEQKADNITFSQADIFASLPSQIRKRSWDILVSNPPYVSAHGFAHQTSRSVRNFEPKLAQVPEPRPGFHAPNPGQEADDDGSARACRPEDVFYARLLEIASVLETRVMLFEVGDMDQASRAAAMALGGQYGLGEAKVEIWRDWPDARPEPGEATSLEIRGQRVPVRGSGHGRSVFIVRDCDC